MTSSREQKMGKRCLALLCPSVTHSWPEVLLAFVSLEDIGRKILGLLHHVYRMDVLFMFWILAGKRENLKKKSKKEVFVMGTKTRQHGYFCIGDPQVINWRFVTWFSLFFFAVIRTCQLMIAFRDLLTNICRSFGRLQELESQFHISLFIINLDYSGYENRRYP